MDNRNHIRRLLSAILACFLLSCAASLRAGAQDDFGVWQYFTVSKSFDNGLGVLLRLEHRSKANTRELDCALVMPGISYKPVKWFQFGFYYDFAMAQKANRHVLLPYFQFSGNFGRWNLLWREMGQYVVNTGSFLLRSKFQVQYSIPGTPVSPMLALEPYTDKLQLARSTVFVGFTFKLGSRVRLESGYNLYYLKAADPHLRHLFNFGFSVNL